MTTNEILSFLRPVATVEALKHRLFDVTTRTIVPLNELARLQDYIITADVDDDIYILRRFCSPESLLAAIRTYGPGADIILVVQGGKIKRVITTHSLVDWVT